MGWREAKLSHLSLAVVSFFCVRFGQGVLNNSQNSLFWSTTERLASNLILSRSGCYIFDYQVDCLEVEACRLSTESTQRDITVSCDGKGEVIDLGAVRVGFSSQGCEQSDTQCPYHRVSSHHLYYRLDKPTKLELCMTSFLTCVRAE